MSGRARTLFLLAASAALCAAAAPTWLDLVGPIVSPAEKKVWLSLSVDERAKFEENFWADKAISPQEYYQRLAYADAQWGGSQRGSSANTDPGRVYLSLGPPNKVSHFASSRIFVPMEIWYYDVVPGLLNTELRLIFFKKNSVGFLQLYSPTTDTLRALLINQSSTRTMFGPNDTIDENAIRQNLLVPPAEDEIITASVNVATGIKYSGNDEIIGQILSPRQMLSHKPKTSVETRFFVDRPKIDFLLTPSPYGGSQVDLAVDLKARREIDVEVINGPATVYRNVLNLRFPEPQPLQYLHRLDLLPGEYRVLIGVDGQTFPYLVDVPAQPLMSEIMRVSQAKAVTEGNTSVHSPFEFAENHFYPDFDGRSVLVALAHPGAEVQWTIRRGSEIVWRQKNSGTDVAVLTLPAELPHGRYRMEAVVGAESRNFEFELTGSAVGESTDRSLLSFNANLSSASRQALIGHELLLRGKSAEAQTSLLAALRLAPLKQARIDLARIDALAGHWDDARNRVREVLAEDPKNFEALCVYAFIEAGLQDYSVASELYQRALAIEDSPAVRLALAKLPQQQ
jgi:GWxTD domain-containing protein